ncbi:EMB2654, partial [Symbiodinium microadriaticum]
EVRTAVLRAQESAASAASHATSAESQAAIAQGVVEAVATAVAAAENHARDAQKSADAGSRSVETAETHASAARNALLAVQTNAELVREKAASAEQHSVSVKGMAEAMAEQASALQATSSAVGAASERTTAALSSEAERHLAMMSTSFTSAEEKLQLQLQQAVAKLDEVAMPSWALWRWPCFGLAAATASEGAESFEDFVQRFHRSSYEAGSREFEERHRIFQARAEEVQALNRRPSRRWTAGLGPLADYRDEELQALRGWRGTAGSQADDPSALVQVRSLPEHFNWTSLAALREVASQGSCGSCWAVTSAVVLTAHAEISGRPRSFSAQELVDCVPNPKHCGGKGGCTGATVELAMSYAMHVGLRKESEMPYKAKSSECGLQSLQPAPSTLQTATAFNQDSGHEALDVKDQYRAQVEEDLAALAYLHEHSDLQAPRVHRAAADSAGLGFGLQGWEKLPPNRQEPLLRALYERGPVGVSATVSLTGELLSLMLLEDSVIDHAVTLIGYGRDSKSGDLFHLIQNSWGSNWGEASERYKTQSAAADGAEASKLKEELEVQLQAAVQEESENSEGLEPAAESAFDWFPSLWRVWGPTKGGLCTQAFLAVLMAADGRWKSLSLQELRLRMQAALQRSGLEAAVTLRCSRELKSSLEQALSAAQTARALLIGICYKEDEELRLEGSWNDVEDMRSWLLRQGIVREQDTRVLCDSSGDVTLMPSRNNILTQLEWLLRGENRGFGAPHGCCSGELPEENLQALQLFLLFAGHGDHAELLPSDWRRAGPIREREDRLGQTRSDLAECAQLTQVVSERLEAVEAQLRAELAKLMVLGQQTAVRMEEVCTAVQEATAGSGALSGSDSTKVHLEEMINTALERTEHLEQSFIAASSGPGAGLAEQVSKCRQDLQAQIEDLKNRSTSCETRLLQELERVSEAFQPQPESMFGHTSARQESWTSIRSVQPNTITYNAIISACEKAAQWLPIPHLLEDAKLQHLQLTVVTYNTVISATRTSGRWQLVLSFMQEMLWNSIPWDIITYNSGINALGHCHCWAVALSLLHDAEDEDFATNTITYNASMSACERAGQWQHVLCILRHAQRRRIRSDIVTYNTAVSACDKSGHWQQALCLLEELCSCHVQPDAVTFNSAICACSESWVTALYMLRQIAHVSVQPTLVSYNSAIAACKTEGRWELAAALLEEAVAQEMRANAITYSAVISACEVDEQWETALSLLQAMEELSVVAHCAAICVCGRSAQWQRALSLFTDIGEETMRPSIFAFNVVINALGEGGQWQGALQLVREALEDYVRVDSISYSSALSACGDSGAWRQAVGLCSDAGTRRLVLNLGTYNTAIGAFRSADSWPMALLLHGEVSDQLGPVQTFTNSLISACGDAGAWASALWAFEAQEVDEVSCIAALSACRKAHEWQQALWLLHRSRERRIQMELTCFNLVISTCAAQHWEMSLASLDELHASRPFSTIFGWGTVVSATAAASSWPEALQLLDGQLDKGSPTVEKACGKGWQEAEVAEKMSFTSAALSDALEDAGLWRQSLRFLDYLGAQRFSPTSFLYMSSVRACLAMSGRQQALELCRQMRWARVHLGAEDYQGSIDRFLKQKETSAFHSQDQPGQRCFFQYKEFRLLSPLAGVVTQAFRKVSLAVHPDKKRGNASLLAKLVAAKELVLLEMEEALRRGEDELSKAAGRLKWLKCQCNSCAPLIVKSGRFGPAARAFILQKIARDGATETDGIVAWKREKEKEKLAHRELSKLQTMDRRHQLKQAELVMRLAPGRDEAELKPLEPSKVRSVPAALRGMVLSCLPLPAHAGRRKALVIGCSYFESNTPLKGAINDAWNVLSLLRHTLQISESQVRFIVDGTRSCPMPPQRRPTAATIAEGLQWLAADTLPGDEVFLYFAGYGALLPHGVGSFEACLVPIDYAALKNGSGDSTGGYRLVPLTEVSQALSKLPAGCKATVVLDCCHSSLPGVGSKPQPAMFQWAQMQPAAFAGMDQMADVRARRLVLPSIPLRAPQSIEVPAIECSLTCYSACHQAQWCGELPIEGVVQGAFTWAWVKAMVAGNCEGSVSQVKASLQASIGDLQRRCRWLDQTPLVQMSKAMEQQVDQGVDGQKLTLCRSLSLVVVVSKQAVES